MEDTELKQAMNKALFYLGLGQKSCSQMRDYLMRKGFHDDAADIVIEKLIGYGYLDDKQLAERVVEATISTKSRGKRSAKQKLYRIGIDGDIAETALDAIDSGVELENARYWAEKIFPTLDGQDIWKRKEKLYRRLVSKGFSYETVKEAIESIDKEEIETLDIDTIDIDDEKIIDIDDEKIIDEADAICDIDNEDAMRGIDSIDVVDAIDIDIDPDQSDFNE